MTTDDKTLDAIGRVMHESWSATKRTQGFHGPLLREGCVRVSPGGLICGNYHDGWRCEKFHPDLIPWEQLPEAQKDINRHAADALIEGGVLLTPEQVAAERNEVECAAYEQGLDRAHQGEQEVYLPEEGLDGAPDDWYEKPFCRFVWWEDSGDRSVGIQPSAGWALSTNQTGTVYETLREQAEARVQAAQAAALEMAAQHYLTTDPESAIAYCACDVNFNYGTCNREWGEHILSLANTDALSKVKAQAVEAALDRVWILMAEGWEPEAAMEKVKEEGNG